MMTLYSGRPFRVILSGTTVPAVGEFSRAILITHDTHKPALASGNPAVRQYIQMSFYATLTSGRQTEIFISYSASIKNIQAILLYEAILFNTLYNTTLDTMCSFISPCHAGGSYRSQES